MQSWLQETLGLALLAVTTCEPACERWVTTPGSRLDSTVVSGPGLLGLGAQRRSRGASYQHRLCHTPAARFPGWWQTPVIFFV